MRAHLKEISSGYNDFFSDLQNWALLTNGGHLEFVFLYSLPLDMSNSSSPFSALLQYTALSEGSSERDIFRLQ